MAISVKEAKAWIDTLDPNNLVAVDDGGLTLVELTRDRDDTGAFLEVGGIPEEEDPDHPALVRD